MRRTEPSDPQVLTLIADPAASSLTADLASAAARVLGDAGAETGAPDWLAEGVACDVPYQGLDAATAENVVRASLAGARLDLAAQPREGRRKRALIADMDSTIVTSETLDELAEAMGLKEAIAAITARAMNGELDFAAALRERVRMLEGLAEAEIARTLDRVELSPGARTLVQTMKANGAATALVSGGFTAIAGPVAEQCGFDRVAANTLTVADGRLTGTVGEPILGKEAKLATLNEVAAELGCGGAEVAAVGDGANDLPMLLAAGLGVAYHAKPSVKEAARVCVDHGDLTALLYLQGYRTSEFVD